MHTFILPATSASPCSHPFFFLSYAMRTIFSTARTFTRSHTFFSLSYAVLTIFFSRFHALYMHYFPCASHSPFPLSRSCFSSATNIIPWSSRSDFFHTGQFFSRGMLPLFTEAILVIWHTPKPMYCLFHFFFFHIHPYEPFTVHNRCIRHSWKSTRSELLTSSAHWEVTDDDWSSENMIQ